MKARQAAGVARAKNRMSERKQLKVAPGAILRLFETGTEIRRPSQNGTILLIAEGVAQEPGPVHAEIEPVTGNVVLIFGPVPLAEHSDVYQGWVPRHPPPDDAVVGIEARYPGKHLRRDPDGRLTAESFGVVEAAWNRLPEPLRRELTEAALENLEEASKPEGLSGPHDEEAESLARYIAGLAVLHAEGVT